MDSSPRNPESGRPQTPERRTPVGPLSPLDLGGWLRLHELARRNAGQNADCDDAARSSLSQRSDARTSIKTFSRLADARVREPDRVAVPGRGSEATASTDAGTASVTFPSSHDDRLTRAAAYLAKIPPAVAGERGHNRTFHAACILVQGFDLSVQQARPLLIQWNERCIPPWSAAELEHKLADALEAADSRPKGYLANRGPRGGGKLLRHDHAHGMAEGGPASPSSHLRNPTSASPSPPLHRCPDGQEANPHRLASEFLNTNFVFKGGVGLRCWRDEFHAWDGAAYQPVPGGEMRAQLTRWIAEEFEQIYRSALWQLEFDDSDQNHTRAEREIAGRSAAGLVRSKSSPRPIPVTSRLVSDTLQALASLLMVPTRQVPVQPAWLPAWPLGMSAPIHASETAKELCFAANEILPAKNALVHLPSLMTAAPCIMPPSPRFFNSYALEYDFATTAPVPREWLGFLDQIWETDIESIAALQEWFGYLLTPDTRQQKILMMVGPKRSGRGTIARVLKALAGSNSVVNPTLSTLARPFGLSSLISKPIAVFPDARLSSRPDNAAIVECLLSISGEDDQTIDRKHLPAWTGKLTTRFVLISNELPRLRDISGALAGRLIILRFTRSFYGQEDTLLFDRLRPELPGILRWAIAGWERLHRRGRFLQPRSARELVATMDELASPIAAFLRDRCIVESDATCPVPAIYESWRSWCHEHGRGAVGDEHSFGRDLHAAIPALTTIRPRTPLGRVRHYTGIRLRTALDHDAVSDPGESAASSSAADDVSL
jgi:putative DNA primase/helicase